MAKRGGTRPGAGRPTLEEQEHRARGTPVGPHARRLRQDVRRKQLAILQSDLTPLDIMMGELRYQYEQVELIKAQIVPLVPEGKSYLQMRTSDEDSARLLSNYNGARERLFTVAEKTAAWLHPKMSTIEPPRGDPIDLSKLTDKELDVYIALQRKISASFGTPR